MNIRNNNNNNNNNQFPVWPYSYHCLALAFVCFTYELDPFITSEKCKQHPPMSQPPKPKTEAITHINLFFPYPHWWKARPLACQAESVGMEASTGWDQAQTLKRIRKKPIIRFSSVYCSNWQWGSKEGFIHEYQIFWQYSVPINLIDRPPHLCWSLLFCCCCFCCCCF